MNNTNIRREPYVYTGIPNNLSALSTAQLSFQVASNFDFFMCRFSFYAYTTTANRIPSFDIRMNKNDYNIFYDYAPANQFAGMLENRNAYPWIRYPVGLANWFHFNVPYKFEAKSNIIIDFRETGNDSATVIRFSVEGYKEIKA